VTFPYHAIPDGSAAQPHRNARAIEQAIVPEQMVWDRYPRHDPWIELTDIQTGHDGFQMIWTRYPAMGATLVLASNAVVILSPIVLPTWREYWPWPQRVAVVALGLLALDDSVQHALGVWTPLDAAWKAGGRDLLTGAFEFSGIYGSLVQIVAAWIAMLLLYAGLLR
jgi:hypothetical protein